MKLHFKLFLPILLSFNMFLKGAQENKESDFTEIELNEAQINTKDLEKHIQKVSPRQFSNAVANIAKEIASLLPPDKIQETLEKINMVITEEVRKNPDEIKYKKIAPKINLIIEEMLDELQQEKNLNSCIKKMNYAFVIFKKNITLKTATKTIIYRFAASLDSILMTYLFITHNISFVQALQLGAVDIVGKFILYYIYDRVWQTQCCNTIWDKLKCCKKDEISDEEDEDVIDSSITIENTHLG